MVEILPIPKIREELKIAATAGKLVPFIGAGASMLAGAPNWSGFADATLKFFIAQGKFNFSQFEQLKHLPARIKLSIAKSLQEKHGIRIDYEKILHPRGYPDTTGHPDTKLGQRLYGHLSALSKTFVTTNYDRWLEQELPSPDLNPTKVSIGKDSTTTKRRNTLYKTSDFTHDNLTTDTVIHLHGSLDDPATMVLTTEDYIIRYLNDRKGAENQTLTFLENLFDLKNVLFIGYSLQEIEILEYVIQKAGKSRDKKEAKHFILQGYYSHQKFVVDEMEDYYLHECGVQLLPFLLDHNGYRQLLNVIEDFSTKIPVAPTPSVQELHEMEALLND
jgi:hypothetical protein